MGNHNKEISPQNQYYQGDEITLKELILKIQEFWGEVWKQRKLVIIISGLFGVLFMLRSFFAPITYSAELTFMVNEDEGGGGGAISSILGQFGLKGAESEHNFDKILTLSRSRRIVGEAIFEKAVIEGEEDYIANHIIKIYDFHNDWQNSEAGLQGFLFDSSNNEIFNNKENLALKAIVGKVVGNSEKEIEGIFSNSFNEDTGIMTLQVISESETLSIDLVKKIYSKLSTFYIDKTTERQGQTYKVMKSKVDSIELILNVKDREYLKFQDSNHGLYLRQYESKKIKLQREVQILTIAFGEALKNLEIADFSLKNATPFFQEIDSPIPPLNSSFSIIKLIKSMLLGSFIGFFLLVLWVIVRKLYDEAMLG